MESINKKDIKIIKIPLKKIENILIEDTPKNISVKTFDNGVIYKGNISLWTDGETSGFGFQKNIINSSWSFLNGKNNLIYNNDICYEKSLFDFKSKRQAIGVSVTHLYIVSIEKSFLNRGMNIEQLANFMKKELNCIYAIELQNNRVAKSYKEKFININLNKKEFKTVISSSLYIHDLPTKTSKILGSYNIGTLLETFETHDKWVKTAHGWVLEKYLI